MLEEVLKWLGGYKDGFAVIGGLLAGVGAVGAWIYTNLRDPKPLSKPKSGQITGLSYSGITELDPATVAFARSRNELSKIRYHQSIVDVCERLSAYDNDQAAYLAKIPYMQSLDDPKEREEAAASYCTDLHNLAARVRAALEENEVVLKQVIARLELESADDSLFQKSVTSFGRFAALHVIKALKSFHDIQDGKPVAFFEQFPLAKGGWALFECGDRASATGKHVFGIWYWLAVHVGQCGDDYGHALLPIDLAREIRAGKVDRFAIFCEWLLPQIAFNDSASHVDRVDSRRWRILSEFGSRADSAANYDGEWADDDKRTHWG